MKITGIRLYQYRNHLSLSFQPEDAHNVIYGKNAEGKTNILEAVTFCLTGTFLRNATEKDLIHYEKDEAMVQVDVEERFRSYDIRVRLRREHPKEIRVNGEKVKSLAELERSFPVTWFTPEDLRIAKDSPQYRRRFINEMLTDLSPVYRNALLTYQKALLQRNTLLKAQHSSQFMRQLNAIDAQLIKSGSYLMNKRADMALQLQKEAAPIHRALTGDQEELNINYRPDIVPGNDPVESFLQALSEQLEKDRRLKSTGRGPHRDELELKINEHPLRLYGSQGQQRTAVLSLKLAEAKIKREKGKLPILLFDDVYSELDQNRQQMISRMTETHQLLTTTVEIPYGNNDAVWHLKDGSIDRKR